MSNCNIEIAFICDDGFVMPTVVAITSLIKNKDELSHYYIHIIGADLSEENITVFQKLEVPYVKINIIHTSANKFRYLHQTQEGSNCVATIAALLKFELPELLPNCNKILYLDGDILILKDLLELYNEELDDKIACVVIDSGSIYYKHKYVQKVKHYFNSGVMLLNLKKMRSENTCETLIRTKGELNDSSLMDQNVFNIVFDGKVKLLPLKYNYLVRNLTRAKGKYTMDDINKLYEVNYNDLNEIKQDSYIVHFSSKDKPWKYFDTEMADIWYDYFLSSPLSKLELIRNSINKDYIMIHKNINMSHCKVSVVIPVYNTRKYINECLDSVINQTLKEIEIICIDDGSTDSTLSILKKRAASDTRIVVFYQKNKGQSSARNVGIENAQGEYIYFLDSDDYISEDALEILYEEAQKFKLDLLLFNGTAFFENKTLENNHKNYNSYYNRKKSYPEVYSGSDIYVEQVKNGDYKVSPCMQFIKSSFLKQNTIFFKEGIIHEDNLFSFVCMLQASKVKQIDNVLFFRRVREDSTMTSSEGFKNFKGYFLCVVSMVRFLENKNFNEQVLEMAGRQIASHFKKAKEIYNGLNSNDKKLIKGLNPKDKLYFQVFMKSLTEGISMNNIEEEKVAPALLIFKSEVHKIYNSWSYKVVRVIEFAPRKIFAGLRCIKEHGLKYTLNRIKQKALRIIVRQSR